MKKSAFFLMAAMCFAILPLTGCGSSESTVVEAPAEATGEEIPAMEGMTDDEYDKAMEAAGE